MKKNYQRLSFQLFFLAIFLPCVAYSQNHSSCKKDLVISLNDSNTQGLISYIDSIGANSAGSKEIVQFLFKKLADVNPSVRWHAAEALSENGGIAIPLLIDSLKSKNENARLGSVIALGKIGIKAKDAEHSLITLLKDQNSFIRENAVIALGKISSTDSTSIKELIKLFSDQDPFTNGKAATALGRIGKAAVPFLIKSLRNKNENVRLCSVIALEKIGSNSKIAEDVLVQMLSDTNENIRYTTVAALGKLRNPSEKTISALIKTLDDKDEDVRKNTVNVLENFSPFRPAADFNFDNATSLIDSLTPMLMKRFKVPGVSIALINNRELTWSKCYGVSDIKKSKPVTQETLFEACSMTKPLFAYIVMKLAEDGKLNLDIPLIKYIKEPVQPDQNTYDQITARMVLSHTSGFPNWRKGEEEREGPLPVLFKPGSKFGYSGEGMYYLQKIVEEITGEPLELYAKRTLLDCLNLHHTSFVWTNELDSLIACGYDTNGAFLQKTKYTHANSAYTLYTTPEDYAKFLIEIMKTNRSAKYSLSKESINNMLTCQINADEREPIERPGNARGLRTYWALGWGVNTTLCGPIYYHSGTNRSGFKCYCQFNPNTGTGIVIMTNSLNGTELWSRLIKTIGDL